MLAPRRLPRLLHVEYTFTPMPGGAEFNRYKATVLHEQPLIEKISDNAIFDVLGEHPENEELIKIAFRVAFRAIQREHNMQVQIAGIQVQNIFDRCMREKENEINALKERYNNIEKKYILRGLLLRINITDKTLIQYRATDIEQMSIFERHKVTNELYKRFLPFSELLDRGDLGVEATSSDLRALETWLEQTTEDAILRHFGTFSFVQNSNFNGKEMGTPLHVAHERLKHQLNYLNNKGISTEQAYNKLEQIFRSYLEAEDIVVITRNDSPFWGHRACEIDYYKNGINLGHAFQEFGGGWWGHSTGIFGQVSAGKGRGVPVYDHWNNIVERRNKELSNTISAIKFRARELFEFETNSKSELHKIFKLADYSFPQIVFPSNEFNRLIDQVNSFLSEGL